MADYRYKLRTFSKPTSTSTAAVTGFADNCGSFVPKAVLLWSTLQTADGLTAPARFLMGFSTITDSRCLGSYFHDSAISNGAPILKGQGGQIIITPNGSPTVDSMDTLLASVASGSATFSWLINAGVDAELANANVFHCLAIGGDDVDVAVGSCFNPATTGLATTTVTDLAGKQLTGLFLIPVLDALTSNKLGMQAVSYGFTDGVRQGASSCQQAFSDSAAWASDPHRVQRTDCCYLQQHTDGNIIGRAGISALGVGEFTLDYATTFQSVSFTNNAGAYYLAIAGPAMHVFNLTQPASSVPLPFTPGAAGITSVGKVADPVKSAELRWAFGVTDGTAIASNWIGDEAGAPAGAHVTTRAEDTTTFVVAATPSDSAPTIDASAVPTLTMSSMSLDWTGTNADLDVVGWALEGGTDSVTGASCTFASGDVTEEFTMRRQRRFPIAYEDNHWIFLQRIEFICQMGVGVSVPPSDNPRIMFRLSRDGGQTWGNTRFLSIGRIGQYTYRAYATALGRGRNLVGELTFTEAVPFAVIQCTADLEVGTS